MNEQLLLIMLKIVNGVLGLTLQSSWFYVVLGMVTAIGYCIGKRLIVIQAPEKPYLSPILRQGGVLSVLLAKAFGGVDNFV